MSLFDDHYKPGLKQGPLFRAASEKPGPILGAMGDALDSWKQVEAIRGMFVAASILQNVMGF